MIRLIGPGGAGKSTIGARLAERLDVTFLDLDRHLVARVGDISEYIGRHGYGVFAVSAATGARPSPFDQDIQELVY
jgi:shikimate kinase